MGLPACQYEYGSPALLTRTVSFDGSTKASEQQFTYATQWDAPPNWQTKTTTVVTTDLLRSGAPSYQTVYTYSGFGVEPPPNQDLSDPRYFAGELPLESLVRYQDWGGTNGVTLRTVNKTWGDQFSMTCESTTQGGQTPRVDYAYGAGAQVTDKKEWDWGCAPVCGTSTSGTPTRETKITYQSFAATSFAIAIVDRPCQIITYESGGSRAAETDYFYDGGSTLCPTSSGAATGVAPTSSVVSHDYTNYAYNSGFPRGNATKKVQVFIGGASNPTTIYTYDDTGQVLTMKDPCGNKTCADISDTNHTTTYSYTDSPAGGNPAGQSNAYLTTLTLPPTSGVNHIEKFTYNYADGQLASSTDQNSQITSYFYGENSEGLDRLTGINYPDCVAAGTCNSSTHSASYTYNDASFVLNTSPSVTTQKLVSNSPSNVYSTSKALLDGVGDAYSTELTSDPSGTDYTRVTYDALGRKYQQWNPTRCNLNTSPPPASCANEPSFGSTVYAYDALGRATNVKHPDNNNTTTSYSGNCATATDPQSKARKTCADGLGRLTSVLEDPGSSPHLTSTTQPLTPTTRWIT